MTRLGALWRDRRPRCAIARSRPDLMRFQTCRCRVAQRGQGPSVPRPLSVALSALLDGSRCGGDGSGHGGGSLLGVVLVVLAVRRLCCCVSRGGCRSGGGGLDRRQGCSRRCGCLSEGNRSSARQQGGNNEGLDLGHVQASDFSEARMGSESPERAQHLPGLCHQRRVYRRVDRPHARLMRWGVLSLGPDHR